MIDAYDGSLDFGMDDIEAAIHIIIEIQRASTSSIQRRMRIGYTRAARIMDVLLEAGIIGPPRGIEPREIIINNEKEAVAMAKKNRVAVSEPGKEAEKIKATVSVNGGKEVNFEYREVKVEKVTDFDKGIVTETRLDTGVEIENRAMTTEERQMNIPLDNE